MTYEKMKMFSKKTKIERLGAFLQLCNVFQQIYSLFSFNFYQNAKMTSIGANLNKTDGKQTLNNMIIILKHIKITCLKWTYALFDVKFRVATLSKL